VIGFGFADELIDKADMGYMLVLLFITEIGCFIPVAKQEARKEADRQAKIMDV
jgi:hypothetical protein